MTPSCLLCVIPSVCLLLGSSFLLSCCSLDDSILPQAHFHYCHFHASVTITIKVDDDITGCLCTFLCTWAVSLSRPKMISNTSLRAAKALTEILRINSEISEVKKVSSWCWCAKRSIISLFVKLILNRNSKKFFTTNSKMYDFILKVSECFCLFSLWP